MAEYKASFDLVVSELNSLDNLKYCEKQFKKRIFWEGNWVKDRFGRYSGGLVGSSERDSRGKFERYFCYFDTIFGQCRIYEDKTMKRIGDRKYIDSCDGWEKWKSYPSYHQRGIEILGMKPNRTKDGKYKYEGITITELKECCKKNGLKGYSGKDKIELIRLLIKM